MSNESLKRYHVQIEQYQPFGSWPPYDFQPLKQILAPANQKAKGRNLF